MDTGNFVIFKKRATYDLSQQKRVFRRFQLKLAIAKVR